MKSQCQGQSVTGKAQLLLRIIRWCWIVSGGAVKERGNLLPHCSSCSVSLPFLLSGPAFPGSH